MGVTPKTAMPAPASAPSGAAGEVGELAGAFLVERCARLCAERAWRLASALLRDRDAAYDAVQQALLVAAQKPECVPADDPWPWFSVVLVHEVRNIQRKRRPLTNRLDEGGGGSAMERADTRRAAPDVAAERADEAARLWAALDHLPQPEREAVLLTHLGGLSHAAAASALDVPRQTVSARAERGLDALARRLQREPRTAARALAVVPLIDPTGGLAEATAAWTKTALAAHGVSAGIGAAAAAGGTLMATTKAAWIAGLAVALGAGFVGGAASDGLGLFPAERRAETRPASAAPLAGATAPGATGEAAPRLSGNAAGAAEARAKLEAENARLAARLTELEQEVAALKAQEKTAGGSGGGSAPTFTFGEAGRLDAIRQTNWPAIAEAAKIVDDAVIEMFTLTRAGKPIPKEIQLRLQENVEKVRTYEYRTIDKLPTAAKHNGELTHPISVTNLVAATLAKAGLPLTAGQIADIDRLGAAFDQQFAHLREGWTAVVPRAQRILDEYRLKGRFTDDLYAVLTAEQRAALIDPAFRGVAGLDLNDPTLMILHTSPVLTGADAPQVRAKVGAFVRKNVGLAAEAVSPPLDALLDAFVARALRGAEPVPSAQAKHYTYAQGLQAGEATAALVEGMLADVELAPAAREALLQDPTWYVPRLVTP